MVLILRVVCLILWVVVAAASAPSFGRVARGFCSNADEYRTAYFFFALLSIIGIGRWFLAPYNDQIFAAIYVLTAGLAVYVLILTRRSRSK
jgi:hypothetical protein